jgi:hypothetical protein
MWMKVDPQISLRSTFMRIKLDCMRMKVDFQVVELTLQEDLG